MEVLVTGAGGFVGEALCRALVASGDEVVAMWHRHEQRLNALSGMGGLTKVQGDICNSERVVDLCSGVDAVCHLAVLPPGMPGAAETNIQGTQNVVDACCRADVEHLVYASSMSVYDFVSPQYLPVDEAHPCQPLQDYGREKLRGEALCLEACRAGDLRVCALRLAGIFGPGKPHGAAYAFTRAIMADEPVAIEVENAGVTEGALCRHFINKEDLCQQAYCQVVTEMITTKESISESSKSIRAKFREWVKVSYEYFDRFPDAFTYVVLIPHDFPEGLDHVTSRQSNLLAEIVEQLPSIPNAAMRSAEVAVCHFTGVMLNVPRLINEGALKGPASGYTDEVVGAIWRMFKMEE